MSSVPLAPRGLLCLALGALLAALPFGTAVRVLGTLTAAAGLWQLQPPIGKRIKQRFASATSLVAAWALVLLLDVTPLGQACLLAAFLIAGGALTEIATLNAWSYATKAWKAATRIGAVVYGVSTVVGIAQVALGAGDLLTDSLLGRAGPACLALPVVSVVRACALSKSDQSQASAEAVPRAAAWAASKSALAAMVLFLLLPVWLLLPLIYHHQVTPPFSAVVKHRAKWAAPSFAPAALVDVTARPWTEGKPVGFRTPEDPEFPRGLQSAGHSIDLVLHHGGERLLRVEHEILATLDVSTGALRGCRTRTKTLDAGRGFRAHLLTRIDLDATPHGSGEAMVRRIPFSFWVALLSGAGESDSTTQRLRGLTLGKDQEVEGVAPTELPWWAPGLEGMGSLFSPSAPPEEGLRYLVAVVGQLELRRGKVTSAHLSSTARFRANTLEYDYSLQLDERASVQHHASKRLSESRRHTWTNRRRWAGHVW